MIPRSSISTFTVQSHQRRSRLSPPDNAAMTPAAPIAATFLARDIDDQNGARVLLPSLSTEDRLRLSECCHDLVQYRYNLSSVTLCPHYSFANPSANLRAALNKLLMDQSPRGGGLEYLCVPHRSLLGVLDLASKGCFRRLKTLHLRHSAFCESEGACYVERALLGGGLANLEEFRTGIASFEGPDLRRIVAALGQGACPRLRRLILKRTLGPVAIGDTVAEALESGHLHHLQVLDIDGVILEQGGGAAIARALQGGACPQLTRLCLTGSGMRAADGQALGMAMRAGVCANLEDLDLNSNRFLGDQCFVSIFEALEAGSYPYMKRLDLTFTNMGPPAGTALGHALRSGNCRQLQALKMHGAFSQPGASLHVLQVIRQGRQEVVPNLLHLVLSYNKFGQEHGQLLGEAIGVGAFPKLEKLRLSSNRALGDGGVVAIVAGLEGGGCPHLRKLQASDVGMGPQGGQALGRALASGKLSCLQSLDLGWNEGIGDEAMRNVVVRLKDCHKLRKLEVAKTGMGREAGGALVQALREGAWPQLNRMCLERNGDLFVDEEVVRGMVEVVDGGKVQHLKYLNLVGSWLTFEMVFGFIDALQRGGCFVECVEVEVPDMLDDT